MRALCIQIQPCRLTAGTADELVARLRSAAGEELLRYVGDDRGDDDGSYINIHFTAPDHAVAWSRLQELYDESDLGQQLTDSTIVTCEGESGWDDYLLLHHFDLEVEVDPL
jgi:hypothetical protein